MSSIRLLCVLGLAGLLTACASPSDTAKITYRPEDSKALNIVRAAGISSKLRDVEVPKDTVHDITDSKGFGLAWAASGYAAPLPGISAGPMAAMNLAAWLLAPEADAARHSVIAWMPTGEAGNDPVGHMADLLVAAAIQATKDMGYGHVSAFSKDKTGAAVTRKKGDKDFGMIGFGTRKPQKEKNTPEFIGASGETWFFDPSSDIYSRFIFQKENLGINELEFLVNVSKHLPAWVYFYVAPNKVRLNKTEKLKVPAVVNQGKIHYFVKVKQG